MKKWILSLFLALLLLGCDTPSNFTAASKTEPLISVGGNTISFAEVLEKNKGKKMVLAVWASWCKDCLVRLPNMRQLQGDFPEVSFVFLSQDRNEVSWK